MRPRTYILLILVVVVLAVAAFLVVTRTDLIGGGNGVDPVVTGDDDAPDAAQEGGEPTPEPTAVPQFEEVVVAEVDMPIGYRITRNLLSIETRPVENIALQREEGYVFLAEDIDQVVGRILRVNVRQGQAILQPMLTLDPSDLASMGSDLALYMDEGGVAMSLEIDRESGAAFAMRPGDFVDLMMTLRIVEIDPEFRTALPNETQRVYQPGLLEGQEFLFPSTVQGRLEFIPEINQVAEIIPRQEPIVEGQQFEPGRPIPKRVTQLTVQQAEVMWIGDWEDQDELLDLEPTPVPVVADGEAPPPAGEGDGEAAGQVVDEEAQAADELEENLACVSPANPDQLIPCPVVRDPEEEEPDIVILSLSSQDALVLKWAWERGVDVDLALRSQGDNATFFTTAVSLPQIVNQGGLSVPEESTFDLYPRLEEVTPPPQ